MSVVKILVPLWCQLLSDMSKKFRCLCFANMLYYSSERIFSAGGLTVTNLRASLDETKVEAILLVHLNLMKVDKMEKVGKMIK